jgi:hypothetical protein
MIVPEEKAFARNSALLEGSSVRSAERISGFQHDTILRLLDVAGERCAKLMDEKKRNLHCHHIQGDELWCLVGKKQQFAAASAAEFSPTQL